MICHSGTYISAGEKTRSLEWTVQMRKISCSKSCTLFQGEFIGRRPDGGVAVYSSAGDKLEWSTSGTHGGGRKNIFCGW